MRNTEGNGFAAALRALASRSRSEAELRRWLERKGITEGETGEVIARLRELGYTDDRRFALQCAESLIRNGKGYGPRIRLELRRRGVPEEVASGVLAQVHAEHDETETLKDLMARKFAGFDPRTADDREKRRVMQYFMRRGFSSPLVWQVFREME